MTVAEHVETINLKVVEIVPGHPDRKATPEFNRSVAKLRADGHDCCWLCGSKEKLQVHHFIGEDCEAGVIDLAKAEAKALCLDPYGYNRASDHAPFDSVDDYRNMMVLCQAHHTGVNATAGNPTGIHNTPFPEWILQGVCRDGEDPIPQAGETVEAAEKRLAGVGA
ncbi:MAG TPA: hypothetical protein VF795_00850 [Desulfuromonadaceae bacterium]